MGHQAIIRDLESVARRFTPHRGRLTLTETSPMPASGQVWTTRVLATVGDQEFRCAAPEETLRLIILKARETTIQGTMLHLAAPVLNDTDKAGPEDVLLCENVFGYPVLVAVGAAVTIIHDSLLSCVGQLPSPLYQHLSRAYAEVDGSQERQSQTRTSCGVMGWAYLDEEDSRFIFHKGLVAQMAYLQAPVLALMQRSGLIASDEPKSGKDVIRIDFPVFAPFQAAAAATGKVRTINCSVPGCKVRLKLRLQQGSRSATLQVLKDSAALAESNALDGMTLRAAGVPDVMIANSRATIPGDMLQEGFVLMDNNGRQLEIVRRVSSD